MRTKRERETVLPLGHPVSDRVVRADEPVAQRAALDGHPHMRTGTAAASDRRPPTGAPALPGASRPRAARCTTPAHRDAAPGRSSAVPTPGHPGAGRSGRFPGSPRLSPPRDGEEHRCRRARKRFGRGRSRRAPKWAAALAIVFAFGGGEAAAQLTAADTFHGNGLKVDVEERVTEGANATIAVTLKASVAANTASTTTVTVNVEVKSRGVEGATSAGGDVSLNPGAAMLAFPANTTGGAVTTRSVGPFCCRPTTTPMPRTKRSCWR